MNKVHVKHGLKFGCHSPYFACALRVTTGFKSLLIMKSGRTALYKDSKQVCTIFQGCLL